MFEFEEFQKIPRVKRAVICTEKLDGANAQILIVVKWEYLAGQPEGQDGKEAWELEKQKQGAICYSHPVDGRYDTEFIIRAGSRSRWLTREQDNYGFWRWTNDNAAELFKLGPGRHFGEWWGAGIQRKYGLSEKRFSLFNTGRWNDNNPPPACCHVVPVVLTYNGFEAVDLALNVLRNKGSLAAPGFMNPEGVIAYHSASGHIFKATLDRDGEPKSKTGKAGELEAWNYNKDIQIAVKELV